MRRKLIGSIFLWIFWNFYSIILTISNKHSISHVQLSSRNKHIKNAENVVPKTYNDTANNSMNRDRSNGSFNGITVFYEMIKVFSLVIPKFIPLNWCRPLHISMFSEMSIHWDESLFHVIWLTHVIQNELPHYSFLSDV